MNDHESITNASELVRFTNLLRLDFQLLGKTVKTESHQYLGKIEDYATDLESYFIQKLYVGPSMLKSLSKKKLIISRNQIVEINDKAVIVKGPEVNLKSLFKPVARNAEA